MDKKNKDTKYTRHITRIIHSVRNGEEWNFHKTVWCEGGMKLSDIGTNNVKEDELNHKLWYAMVRVDSWHKTCQIWVTGYRTSWRTMCTK